ncbi:exonuclease SbcCD subunit D [Glycomyces buryatensis]|uniref:Nuclease SbcCD subunit D n=1 Tax=Glycomyces buryatensis TaxID=2570927 RepID=A0A4S8QQ03_9ACTN|nr:exonuclease SbcCD subunit D [Glycomyces buryatensis]THV43499.1 exonuclease SbcCD subunit D [Glycomyces buryatensis]
MRILHTSDWHVGVTLKGRPRLDEQRAVFAQLADIVREERPDLVIVAGDLYDTAAPSSAAQKVLYSTLSALRQTGAEVVAIAGNHDNGPGLEALREWAHAAGIHLRGRIGKASDHIVTGTTESGERWRLAALPFVSQRYAVRAAELFELSVADAESAYADHLRRMVSALTQGFGADEVNLICGHLTVVGGKVGGGEREVHTVADYAVPAAIFPASTGYVALGHLHKAQKIEGPCPIRYSGGPLAVDFGEEDHQPSVTIVDVTNDTPARIREVPLTAAVPLQTVRGNLGQLAEAAESGIDERAWLRVFVTEPARAGLRSEVADLFPRAVQIHIDPVLRADATKPKERRSGRSPGELFGEYLTENGHDDPAVAALFGELYEATQTVAAED